MRRASRPLVAIAATMVVVLVAGCERVSQSPPDGDAAAAAIVATADFGARSLLDVRVAPDQTVLRALRGATEVRTEYGGGFVAEMLGRRSDAGARRDWFFWVDGLLADVGAAERTLADGEEVWWDHHRWDGIRAPLAVVGQWPAPFAGREVAADQPLADVVAEAGARLVEGTADWRVRVDDDAELADREKAWARATRDPGPAGLTARVDGGAVLVQGADGEWSPVPGAGALAAAVPLGARAADGVLLAVAGVDDAAARAAARTIATRPDVLRLRLSVVFDGDGTPIAHGGRAGT